MKKDFKIIGFDADDTLWVNEPYFRETEKKFSELLSDFQAPETVSRELQNTEIQNLKIYGYGIKGFMLSMIETAERISHNSIPNEIIDKILKLGRELLNKSIELLDGIPEILEKLRTSGYKLIVATKGDLLDQERKLTKSGLEKYFHHIEVMSDKREPNYLKLLSHLDIHPEDFLMIGNSMKSDIIPVLNIGGCAVHIPFHTTWAHEEAEKTKNTDRFREFEHVSELEALLGMR